MKTLVIHPKDESTDFLIPIYSNTDWTIINYTVSKSNLTRAIKEHDKIIMMGHGSEMGLLDLKNNRIIINSGHVYLLRNKDCCCIWCNADKFVNKYGLNGFYTGMIISESAESVLYRIEASEEEINESNKLFSYAIKQSINDDDITTKMKMLYASDNNPIINFNKNNLWQSMCQNKK